MGQICHIPTKDNNLHENLNNINGTYKDNELVGEVIKFIEKDKKRPICSPQN